MAKQKSGADKKAPVPAKQPAEAPAAREEATDRP